jgi:hypothetical protein
MYILGFQDLILTNAPTWAWPSVPAKAQGDIVAIVRERI